MKNLIAKKKLKFYTIDAIDIAGKVGMGGRINTVMQAAFFKLANVINYGDAEKYMKEAAKKSYGKRGEKVVQMNYDAIDNAIAGLVEVAVPAAWATTTDGAMPIKVKATQYFDEYVLPILRQDGDVLPVSMMSADGVVPVGTTQYEKRGIAVNVPEWQIESCIQCNQCSLVCPHATLRPVLVKDDDLKNKPEGFETKKAIGKELEGFQYRMQLSPLDCTGCGNCAQVCPAKQKALIMKPLSEQEAAQSANWAFAQSLPKPAVAIAPNNVKNSQFKQPLFEFSGACAGCGETPYIKLVTQLFGDRMVIANATGCTSIYGGSSPTCPYTVNEKGHGPAWANSLFEDNAEFGYGMNLALTQRRIKLAENIEKLIAVDYTEDDIKAAGRAWLDGMNDAEASKAAAAALIAALEDGIDLDGMVWEGKTYTKDDVCPCDACSLARAVLADRDLLVKKSVWIFGGDGWAYDIGYGGLDHVLAQGENVNILVLDTEVYSNTGGQSSKSSPTGAVAKFASAGKRTRKKDLGMMAMSYGYVYVATVGMGANQSQLLKALTEAEAYDGPSLVIAYAPCINHGINMGLAQEEIKRAVEAGYWPLYRYNPTLADEGKNPFALDSKEPTTDYKEFLKGETRYTSLAKANPELADELFTRAAAEAKLRYENYKRLANG